jgi:DNA invertase Pin-like site-specific DNA recombinase
MIFSYVRGSRIKQDTGRQDIQLDKLGIKFDKHYIDKMSVKTRKRPYIDWKLADNLCCQGIYKSI